MSENRIEIGPYDHMDHFMTKAALIVSMDKNEKPNVMALLWKTIGELWMLPVITIAVAPSRYTFECLTKGVKEFTINIPSSRIENTINYTGSVSGRNKDKFKETGLEIVKGKRTKVPTIKDCILSYECKIVHECESGRMASHRLFIGEILISYASKDILK
jgi:flavin reductase (DIM6/NTAB) family NADH-FMN oxidoreductase RutF